VPVIGSSSGDIVEAGGVANAITGMPNASGTISITDADAGQSSFQAVAPASLNGTYGTFTFNNTTGAWTYALDNTKAATQGLTAGQIVHDTLTVTSLDGTASKAIDVTLKGANDNAVITGTATGSMSEDVAVTGGNLTSSGTLTVSDVDTGEARFQSPATLAGSYGTFTFNTTTGAWTYAANNAQSAIQSLGAGQTLTDTITVKSLDGTATQAITVTINGTNDAPAGADKTIITPEDVSYAMKVADFGFSDPIDSPGNALQSVTVNAPSAGTLTLNGVTITTATVVPVSEITAGHLVYTPAVNANGTAYGNFTFQVTDDGGTANGGQNTDQSPNTITFNVTPAVDLSAKWIDYWQFNEGSGTGTTNFNPAVDQVGTITNNTPHSGQQADPVADLRPTWTTGRNDSTAIQFNGVGGASTARDGGWVALAASVTDPLAGQSASKAASLSFWIKTTQVGSNIGWDSPSVIGMENNGGTVDVQWGFINNQGKIGFGIGDNAGLMSNNAINDNQWHSVSISHNFTTGQTYMWVDGIAQAINGTVLAAGQIAPNKFLGFGVTADDGATSDRFLNGALEDARIYDGVLTDAQAQAIYKTELWGSQSSIIANDGHAVHFSLGVNDATSVVLSGLVAGTTVADVTGTHSATVGAGGTLDISSWAATEVVLSNYGSSSFHATVTGTDAGGHTASQMLSVVNSADMYAGTAGNDTLNASANANAHVLAGGSGDDTLIGGAGVDVLIGGTGNDTLNGGGGSDVIRWNYADRGGVDTVQNFGSASGTASLDLRDLLQGEHHTGVDSGNLANYLHFSVAAGSTTVEVKSAGSGSVDQTIVLSGVDLVTGVTASAGQTIDQTIIHNLLNNGKLITD
jgi:VCBS repeat-containing protein